MPSSEISLPSKGTQARQAADGAAQQLRRPATTCEVDGEVFPCARGMSCGEGAIRVVQGKTGAKLTVPLFPELAKVLAVWPRSHQSVLTRAFGQPFTPKGFGNWMADKIGQSGVPSCCITHGLRKVAARRLAEAGCLTNEIAAITGHATLAEISRYSKAAEQRTLARSAISRLAHKPSVHRVPKPSFAVWEKFRKIQ